MRKTTYEGGIRGILFALLSGLLTSTVIAVPLEIKEPGFSLTLPDGFREVPGDGNSPEARRLFVRGTSDDGRSNSYLSISRFAADGEQAFWPEGATNSTKIIGRYSERLNNQDVAVLVSQVISNDTVTIAQSATVPTDPGTLLLDLRTHTDDDKEAQALMRNIIQSLATQSQQEEPPGIQGWRGAAICLAMVAIIFVVILARR
jgi:hypothetical protein